MSSLRIALCFLLCAVFVQAYSDYYRPIPKKPKAPKYAATVLASPPKLNRYYRPQHGPSSYGKSKHGAYRATAGYGSHLNEGLNYGALAYHGGSGHGPSYGQKGPSYPKGKIIAKIPIKSRQHKLKYRNYPIKSGYAAYGNGYGDLGGIVEVNAQSVPLSLVFRSQSSKINVKQMHDSSYGKQYGGPKATVSVDEPHILHHTVTKPIYQEIREIIVPHRKVTQTVQPVTEEIVTNVATSHSAAPAVQQAHAPAAQYNAYQLEPVLYVSPDNIKSQAEYKNEPLVGHLQVEGYHGQPQPLLVSQYSGQLEQQGYGQHFEAQPVALLEQQQQPQQQQQHPSAYEAVQQVQQVDVGHYAEAPAVGALQPAIHADGVTQLAALQHSEAPQYGHQEGGSLYGHPEGGTVYQAPPPPAPLALVTDGALLDTYMKYAHMSTQDLLLPVYQENHLPSYQETHNSVPTYQENPVQPATYQESYQPPTSYQESSYPSASYQESSLSDTSYSGESSSQQHLQQQQISVDPHSRQYSPSIGASSSNEQLTSALPLSSALSLTGDILRTKPLQNKY